MKVWKYRGICSFLSDVTLFVLCWPFRGIACYQFTSCSVSYLPTSLSSLLHLTSHLPVILSQMLSQAALFSKLCLFQLFCFHGSTFSRKFSIIFFVHCPSVFHTHICEFHQSAVHSLFQIINKEVQQAVPSSYPHGSQETVPTTLVHCSLFPVILLPQQLESHMEMPKPT